MLSTKVLEMIIQGRIDELKDLLRDEIYQDALKKKPGAKQRYAAMKKYFGYVNSARACCQKPAMVEFEGKTVTSFTNSCSLAFTSEPCGGIELFTEDDGKYPNVTHLIKRNMLPRKMRFDKIFAEAKSKGYKLTKQEVNAGRFVLRYKGAYLRLGLIDATYSIIDDGGEVMVYHNGNPLSPLLIENDIGLCLILPIKYDKAYIEENNIIVIEV